MASCCASRATEPTGRSALIEVSGLSRWLCIQTEPNNGERLALMLLPRSNKIATVLKSLSGDPIQLLSATIRMTRGAHTINQYT